jgi:CubicO group peptidase (beta-lactamase class C family)
MRKIAAACLLGFANIELEAPVTRDKVFKVGSVSNQFIATGIMLVDAYPRAVRT